MTRQKFASKPAGTRAALAPARRRSSKVTPVGKPSAGRLRKGQAVAANARRRARVHTGCEIIVVHATEYRRYELHREVRARGKGRWFAVEICGDDVRAVHAAPTRWQALHICQDWSRSRGHER